MRSIESIMEIMTKGTDAQFCALCEEITNENLDKRVESQKAYEKMLSEKDLLSIVLCARAKINTK